MPQTNLTVEDETKREEDIRNTNMDLSPVVEVVAEKNHIIKRRRSTNRKIEELQGSWYNLMTKCKLTLTRGRQQGHYHQHKVFKAIWNAIGVRNQVMPGGNAGQ